METPLMPIQAVVAATWTQASSFAKVLGIPTARWIWVKDVEVLRSHSGRTVVVCPGWTEGRPGWECNDIVLRLAILDRGPGDRPRYLLKDGTIR